MDIDELIIKSLRGRLTAEERQRLDEWRDRDEENAALLRRMEGVWSLTGVLASESPVPRLPDADELMERGAALRARSTGRTDASGGGGRSREAETRKPVRLRPPRRVSWLKVAAAAAGLIGVGFGARAMIAPSAPERGALEIGTITTGAEERSTVSLSDGSTIRLGPESRIRLGGNEEERVIDLEGRAFFGVQADSSRRFKVRTRHGEAGVLGTRFEVRSDSSQFRVLVVEGRAQMDAGSRTAELDGGEMGLSERGSPLSESRVEDIYAHLDWMGRTLVFHGTPLLNAVEEIKHRYGVTVTLDDPQLADLSVTMTLTERPLDEVMAVLCQVLVARCTIEGKEVRIGHQATALRATLPMNRPTPAMMLNSMLD